MEARETTKKTEDFQVSLGRHMPCEQQVEAGRAGAICWVEGFVNTLESLIAQCGTVGETRTTDDQTN